VTTIAEIATLDDIELELPARPAVLAELSAELKASDPDYRKVSNLVNKDIGLAAAVVKTANTPFFGIAGRITSVQQAIHFLGLAQVFSLVTGVMLRRAFPENDSLISALWDVSTKRAAVMSHLALNTSVPPDRAYTVGLFQDCGVALLTMRSREYRQTWEDTRWLPNGPTIELSRHVVAHPSLSALLVKHWGLAGEIVDAVKHHHDMDELDTLDSSRTQSFVALSVFANYGLVQALSQDASPWAESVDKAAAILDLSPLATEAWIVQANMLLEPLH